eukprot:3418078-Lingulodinium_polyedra.AAC.1
MEPQSGGSGRWLHFWLPNKRKPKLTGFWPLEERFPTATQVEKRTCRTLWLVAQNCFARRKN